MFVVRSADDYLESGHVESPGPTGNFCKSLGALVDDIIIVVNHGVHGMVRGLQLSDDFVGQNVLGLFFGIDVAGWVFDCSIGFNGFSAVVGRESAVTSCGSGRMFGGVDLNTMISGDVALRFMFTKAHPSPLSCGGVDDVCCVGIGRLEVWLLASPPAA